MRVVDRVCAFAASVVLTSAASAQWNPPAGQWGKTQPTDVRVMTWNIQDGICSTADKGEITLGSWAAIARIVAAMKPDVLVMQEVGDNSGNGTGSGVDSVANLTTTLGLFLHGGADPFRGGTVGAYVQKYAPAYDLPFVFVSTIDDGFNRNVVLSRFPFGDLNGDTRSAISSFTLLADLYAPGGTAGIRGFIFAEFNLPDALYAGNLVVGTAHMRSGGASSDLAERLTAGKNVAYYIDALYNGLGGATPDPNNKVLDNPPAASILPANTPVIWGGDFNEDENSNGRDGPVLWMTRAQVAGGTDGTDRNRSDSAFDDAREFFTNNRSTQSSSKLDYLCWQDSITGAPRLSYIFNSGVTPTSGMPPELVGFSPTAGTTSAAASDHRPVIADFVLPLTPTGPGAFDLVSPADGAGNQALEPTLAWSVSSGATSYTVTLADNPALTSPLLVTPGVLAASYAVPAGVLGPCGTYYWGVTAVNAGGSTDSTPFSFVFSTFNPADYNGDGFVSGDDFDAFVFDFENGNPGADFNGDGFISGDDFDLYVAAFEGGC